MGVAAKGHERFESVGLEQISFEGGKMANILVDGKAPLGDQSSACILESAGGEGTLAQCGGKRAVSVIHQHEP